MPCFDVFACPGQTYDFLEPAPHRTMSEAAERLVAVTSAAQATQTELATTKEELSAVQTAMERQQLAIQAQQQSLAELRTATQSNTAAAIKEAAKTAPGAAAVASAAGSAATSNMAEPGSSPSTTGGDEPFSSPWAAAPATYVPAHQRSPSDILQALANDGEHRAILKKTIEQELNATLKKAFEEKIVELKDEVESAMGRLAFSLQQLQASVSQKGRVLDDLDVRVKVIRAHSRGVAYHIPVPAILRMQQSCPCQAATNANSMMHSEVDLLLKNMLLREVNPAHSPEDQDAIQGFSRMSLCSKTGKCGGLR